MNNKYFTIKQLADEMGISKQPVYRFIQKNHISEAHQRSGVKHYDETVKFLISSHFTKKTTSREAHQSTSVDVVNETLIEMLKNELEIKNEQIKELNARLAEAHQMTHQSQHLHSADKVLQLSDGKKKGVFDFFKNKNTAEK